VGRGLVRVHTYACGRIWRALQRAMASCIVLHQRAHMHIMLCVHVCTQAQAACVQSGRTLAHTHAATITTIPPSQQAQTSLPLPPTTAVPSCATPPCPQQKQRRRTSDQRLIAPAVQQVLQDGHVDGVVVHNEDGVALAIARARGLVLHMAEAVCPSLRQPACSRPNQLMLRDATRVALKA